MNQSIFRVFANIRNPLKNITNLANQRLLSSKQAVVDDDMPSLDMQNPYQTEKKQCILCKYKVQLDYKNPRLLSQFVSPFTGTLYDKHITGLCDKQQKILENEIKKSRWNGFMPYVYRDARFAKDPKLFNPLRPQRPNPH